MIVSLEGSVVDVDPIFARVVEWVEVVLWGKEDEACQACGVISSFGDSVDVVVASSGPQGLGSHSDDAVGVLSFGFAAEKPQAKPAVKVAARIMTCLTLQRCKGPVGSRMNSGNAASVILPSVHIHCR